MVLNTKRLELRHLVGGDAVWIAREIATPEVQKWLTSPPHPYKHSHAAEFIERHRDNPEYRVIERDCAPLGVVSLARGGADPVDLGYWLAQAAWGQGIMTEAASALVGWHFARTDETLLSGWVKGNVASRNVLKKLGFQPHGSKLARSGYIGRDVTVDTVILTKSRWQDLSAAR